MCKAYQIAAQGKGYGVQTPAGQFVTSIPFATYDAARNYQQALEEADYAMNLEHAA